jgi:hypothetical protein
VFRRELRITRQGKFSNIRNICCKIRRKFLLMRVKKLNTIFRRQFITFSAPNTKCHKIVSYLRIRPIHKVRYRSVHKLSCLYFKEDVHFREILHKTNLGSPQPRHWYLLQPGFGKLQQKSAYNSKIIPIPSWLMVDPCRMALISQNAINMRDKYSNINQISSCQ